MTSLTSAPTMLDQFVGSKDKGKESSDLVVNEDGTMDTVAEEDEEI